LKEYKANDIRNIAFIGHGGSGKTSFSELMLFTAGETNRIGKVEEGNTVSDFNANEIERQISISASPLHVEWQGKKINFLDTPGYTDFIGQVNSALHVSDVAVAVVKSVEGVYHGGKVELAEPVTDVQDETRVIVTFLEPGAIDLGERGITLSGGHGTGAAWSQTFQEMYGLHNVLEVAMASATFGLVMGGIIGSPVAQKLLNKHNLESEYGRTNQSHQSFPELVTYNEHEEDIGEA